jgi:hypothetical protein
MMFWLPFNPIVCSLEVILKDASNRSEPRVVSRKVLPYPFDVRSSKPRDKQPRQQADIGPDTRRGTTNERPRLVHMQI